MLSAIAYMAFNCIGYLLALLRGPFWGILVYANVYFNPPIQKINWWVSYLPFTRWSLLTSAIVIISLLLHRDKVSSRKLASVYWLFAFTLLSVLISYTYALFPEDASAYGYKLITYCITSYIIVRGIQNLQQYRTLIFFITALASNLSLNVYLHGSRAADRLEGYGTSDTANANQFGVLLISIIPFTIPFIFHGKWYERLICLLGLPFLINTFILCNSRGSAVAFVLGLMLITLILPDKVIRRYILLSVLVSIPAVIYLADAQFIGRMETLMSTNKAASDEDEGEMAQLSSGRTVIWGYGVDMAKDHPLGVGPNGFKKLARFYMPPEVLTFTPGKVNGVRAAHNTYLQTLVEQGVIGLIIILLMMMHSLLLLRSSLKKIQETQTTNSFLGLSVFALALSLSTTIFAGLTSSRVYYEFFWWQIALSVVMYSLVKKSLNSTPDTT